jgi:hypothetical protein
MKKSIVVLLLCCSTYALFAQDSDTMKPTKVKMKMKPRQNDYPAPGNNMNRTMSTTNSTTTTVVMTTEWKVDPPSLPVIGSDVPADVVTNIKNKFGNNIYDIKKIKLTSGDAYAVRIMDNGQFTVSYVGSDGNVVSK